MYVYVCFDVEDLVHPDSDDIPLAIADMLSADGITASMCVVGEKARLWERRGRHDVIAAVGRHDVCLHTDRHSMHPTVAEYLADKGWDDGVAEAERREGPGMGDLTRLFGRPPSSWGTPGSSWAPQIAAATRRLGIPSHVYSLARAGETGACWYAGQLCYSHLVSLPGGEDACCDDAAFGEALPRLLAEIEEARDRGQACLCLFAGHPTRFRYTAFWDALNYADGQEARPEEYVLAPRRDHHAYDLGLRNLRRMLQAVRDQPGIEITTIGDLNARFAEENGTVRQEELLHLVQLAAGGGAPRNDQPLVSPAQLLDVLARAILARVDGHSLPTELALRTVLGPVDAPPVLEQTVAVQSELELPRLRYLVRHVDVTGHLPASLRLGGVAAGPGAVLRALATALLELASGAEPGRMILTPGPEEPEAAGTLSEAVHRRLPGWPPHRPDLPLDRIALHTRLQSWSLKPAVLRG